MGMTRNQLALVRYVAENNIQKAKDAALCCCAEDTTQKNHYAVTKYQSLLRSGGMNLMELPANVSSFATMEDLTNTYLESRYYLTNEEKELFELIKNMNDVSLQLMEKQIPYLNATLLYGESGVGKTAFSRYVAYKLKMPYLYVNFSRMLDSYLGGTVGEISLALAVDGEPLQSTRMIVTPAAVENFFNVSAQAYIDVPRGCCSTVAVQNTSTQAIEVQNSNLIAVREA